MSKIVKVKVANTLEPAVSPAVKAYIAAEIDKALKKAKKAKDE